MSNRTDSPKDRRLFIRLSINQFIHLNSNNGKEKKTVLRSFASQKGGVGKSTFAIYAVVVTALCERSECGDSGL